MIPAGRGHKHSFWLGGAVCWIFSVSFYFGHSFRKFWKKTQKNGAIVYLFHCINHFSRCAFSVLLVRKQLYIFLLWPWQIDNSRHIYQQRRTRHTQSSSWNQCTVESHIQNTAKQFNNDQTVFLVGWTIAGRHPKQNWLSMNCNWNYRKAITASVCASSDSNYLGVRNHDFA